MNGRFLKTKMLAGAVLGLFALGCSPQRPPVVTAESSVPADVLADPVVTTTGTAEAPFQNGPAIVGQIPPPPPGTVRYCWEEPKVDYEHVPPGLEPEGKWYRPAHLEVREVKMGRWVPCSSLQGH